MNHQAHQTQPKAGGGAHAGHADHGHRWMMFACCVPMLAIVIALAATGVVSVGIVVFAVLCLALMPLLHGGASHGDGGEHEHR